MDDLDKRAEMLENQIKDLVDPKKKEIVVNVDDDLLDDEPYDDRYFINDANKVENIKYFERRKIHGQIKKTCSSFQRGKA